MSDRQGGDAAEFIRQYGPIAERIGRELNIDPKIILAKFGLETGWGRSIIPGTNNLGNIKSPSGKGAFATDNVTRTRDAYLRFEDPEVFADYYADLIRNRFPGAVGTGSDVRAFSAALRPGERGGYAEDARYPEKLANATSLVGQRVEALGLQDAFRLNEPTAAETMPAEIGEGTEDEQPPTLGPDAPLVGGALGLASGVATRNAPTLTNRQHAAAAERLAAAQDRLREAQRVAGRPLEEVQREARRAQTRYDRIDREYREATGRGAAPAAAPEGRASGPKVPGASGAANYARAMAGQQHQLPERLIAQVEDMTGTSPKGAHAVIQQDLERLGQINRMGAGDYRLTPPSPAQMMVPPEVAAQQQQAAAAQEAQQQAARAEAERARIARERALEQRRVRAGQARQTALQGLQEAQRGARGVEQAQSGVNVAQSALERTPAGPTGPMQRLGATKALGKTLGVAAGVGTAMSVEEALQRYQEGDYSGMVIPTLEAVFGSLAMIPPVGPIAAGARGVGMAGSGAMLGLGAIRSMLNRPRGEPSADGEYQ